MKEHFKRAGAALAAAALLALSGCGTSTVSKNISNDGRAGETVFPSIENNAWLEEGTFPNLDNLRRIAPGMSKDQLYDLVGRPHFREGLVAVREWDYIFNFRTGGGVKTCQFKAVFDTEPRAQTFHWMPADCADQLKVAAPQERVVEHAVENPVIIQTRVVETPAPAAPRRVVVSADALFDFGRSGQSDLQAEGRRELDAFAASLRESGQPKALRITGHTDRLGAPTYNDRLSLARANTVRDYLLRSGVPMRDVEVIGRGASEPKVMCAQKSRQALIECLAPNRRVEIEAV